MTIPKAIQSLKESFERLPGIGPKTAQRLTFYLLHVPQAELESFANSLTGLKKNTSICSECFMIDDKNPCSICLDNTRDKTLLCVVEQGLDVLAIEKGKGYKGLYHVLHGQINPLENIGPDEIYIPQLLARIKDPRSKFQELILATNPTMEGEATAMYISKQVKNQNSKIKITRIGRGLPVGSDLEYADDITLQKAFDGRNDY
jgi:recombination protein RecR